MMSDSNKLQIKFSLKIVVTYISLKLKRLSEVKFTVWPTLLNYSFELVFLERIFTYLYNL